MAAKVALTELLLTNQLLDMDQVEQARRDQRNHGGRLTSAIVRLGFVKESDLVEFLGKSYQLPTIDLNGFEIDPEAVSALTRQVCEKHMVIPVSKAGNSLVVAFSDPTNAYVKDDLALLTRSKIEVVVAGESAIQSAIDKYYSGGASKIDNIITEIESYADSPDIHDQNVELVDQEVADGEGPIVKFVNAMLVEAIKTKASDIHIEPYEKRFRIRFRIDGVLTEKIQPPPGAAAAIVSRIKILSRLDISERRKPQDGRMKVRLRTGADVDFRVSCLPTMFGEKVVLRLLDKSNLQVDMAKLGFEADDLQMFIEAIHLPQGMILITGPTGSGKTTTIYSALNELNKPEVNVSTAEDPVEYNLDGVNQVQVMPHIGFTFADALRSFLRQDPEVIMVGEIRDIETAEVAFKAASTGHLVVSTLHTNDAAGTVSRLIEIGVEPYIVAESTSIVVAQRLLRRNCSRCSIDIQVPNEVLLKLGVQKARLGEYNRLKRGEGCENCGGSGLKGRIAIFEVLRMSDNLKQAVYKGASPNELKAQAVISGMRSLRQSALLKLKAGMTTVEEVINTTLADVI